MTEIFVQGQETGTDTPTLIGTEGNRWLFSDGTTLPVARGASEGQGVVGDSGTDSPSSDDQGSEGTEYSLANGFLKDVAEEHRSIIEPYVKKWDAGVQRRFQDLHGQLSPYQQLGADPQELAQAYQLYQLLDEDPERVYHALREQYESGEDEDDGVDDSGDESFQGLPPEIQQELKQQRQVLEALAEFVTNQQQTAQEAAEDKELDSYLGLLREEFGDYDEDYVVAKMYRGMSGEDAVKSWQAAIQKQLNGGGTPPPNLPPILSGGGVVPAEQQNLAKMDRKDVKSLVAQLMSQAHQE